MTVVEIEGQATSSSTSTRRRPSKRDHAIDLIRQATQCTPAEASGTIDWITGFVHEARRQNYGLVYPTGKQLRSRYYKIFEVVMPHGKSSQPGSAHQAIEAVVLDSARDEFSFLHDMQEPGNGEPDYCQVQVCLGVFG